jgi:hypothetical protein
MGGVMNMKMILRRMAWIGLAWAGSGLTSGAAAPANPAPPSDLLLRAHFLGLDRIFADAGAAKQKQIWSLPATADMRNQAFNQLARLPFQVLSNQLPKGMTNQAGLLRPLFEDLLPGESFLEWQGSAGKPTEFVLAVQMPDERARLWSTNLWRTLEGWKLGTLTAAKTEAGEGWVYKHRDGSGGCALTRAGQWVVFGLGPEGLAGHARMVQRIKADGRPGPKPTGHWLEAEANLERLKPWLPPLAPYAHPPVAHLALSNHAEYVRSVVRLEFPEGHGWKSETWVIPKSLILDPLISFTAARGIAPLLAPWKLFRQVALDPPPNQVVGWADAPMPFFTQVAMPVKDAGPQLMRMAPLLPGAIFSNGVAKATSSIRWDSNRHAVVWGGLPVASPQLAAVKDGANQFLLGSLFVPLAGTNRAPPALFKEVENRPNLCYYDWEITGQRLLQWRALYQLADIVTSRGFISTNAPTQRWLVTMAPALGNTVTEVTATSPTELTLVRTSHAGLTGFEMVSLMRWLDSPDFPALSVAGQPKPVLPIRRPKTK